MEDIAAQDVEAETENDVELPSLDCFDRFGREPLYEALGDRMHDDALDAFELRCAVEFRERIGILREARSIPPLVVIVHDVRPAAAIAEQAHQASRARALCARRRGCGSLEYEQLNAREIGGEERMNNLG